MYYVVILNGVATPGAPQKCTGVVMGGRHHAHIVQVESRVDNRGYSETIYCECGERYSSSGAGDLSLKDPKYLTPGDIKADEVGIVLGATLELFEKQKIGISRFKTIVAQIAEALTYKCW